MSDVSVTLGGAKIQTQWKKAGTAGFLGDIQMDDHIYFQPGLFVELNGAMRPKDTSLRPAGSWDINTITIPLNIEYQTRSKCSSRFTIGGGPCIGINLSGQYSVDSFNYVPRRGGDLVFGSDPASNMKEIDLRFGVHISYVPKKKFYIRARYQFGLFNLVPGGDQYNSIKTQSLGVVMGWLFTRCKERERIFAKPVPNHWRGIKKGRWSKVPRLYRPQPFKSYEIQR